MNGLGKGIATKAIAMVIGTLGLVASMGVAPAAARAQSGTGRITPVGAVQGNDGTAFDAATGDHGMGALLPKRQVDPVASSGQRLAALPASADLSTYSVPVGNQGSIGSCVTWAIDYAMLGWYSNHDNRPGQPFNPMYTYSQIHLKDTTDGGGSRATDALGVAYNQGNDTMSHYTPTDTSDFSSLPDASEEANAANYKITGRQTLFSTTSGGGSAGATMIETALAGGKPVAIGMAVRQGFEDLDSWTTLDDDTSGDVLGYHEVLAIGYDQYGVWIQNSWGTGWGSGGYGELSWQVVGKDVFEANTISGFATSSTTDTTPPTMGAVTERFALGQKISSTTEPVNFKWSASDASGVAAYRVYVKTDGGAFTQDTSVPSTATQVTYSLGIGHAYRIAVIAKDGAGNWSSYSYSATVTPGVKDDKAFSVSSPWARYNLTDSYGGTYAAARQAGAWFKYTFDGRDAAVVSPTFSTAGRATLYCDGTSSGLIDTYSSSTVGRKVVGQCRFAQSGTHTIKIVLEGTSGRPWFGVDAFAVLV
jgi:hypothetical protein